MELRGYQNECINKVEEAFGEFNKVLVVLATGLGKTVVFNELAKRQIEKGERVLVLAHREELLEQAAEKMFLFNKIEHTFIRAGHDTDMSKMFYIGSVQTLSMENYLDKIDKDYFSMIIVDEAHHVMANTYQCIIEYFSGAKLLGVTATANRSDGKKLSKFFDTTAFECGIEDAIRGKWLSPVIMRTGNVKVNLSRVRTVAGDFVVSELDKAVVKEFNKIAKYVKEKIADRNKIVIFTPRILSAEILAEVLKKHGMSAEFVCGKSKDRKDIIDRFKNGDTRILVNSNLITEGFDCPQIDCIINLRPTQSKGLFTQMLGRGTRIFEDKNNLLFIDFLWETDKNIVTPCDIFAKTDSISIAMRDFLVNNINKSYDMIELSSYVDMVLGGAQIMEAARIRCQKEIGKKWLRDYSVFAYIIDDRRMLEYEPIHAWEMNRPTQKQIDFIENKCGISCNNVNKGLASVIIDAIVKRMDAGKCSIKQMFFLARNGMFDKAPNMTMKQAGDIMDVVSKNNWQVPSYLKEKFLGEKRLTTPLMNVAKLEIKSVEEGI